MDANVALELDALSSGSAVVTESKSIMNTQVICMESSVILTVPILDGGLIC